MVVSNKNALLRLLGFGLTLIVGGGCVYFDQQRKRKKAVKGKKGPREVGRRPSKDEIQRLFLQEIDNGEKCLQYDWEQSVEHFVNAVVLCANPDSILLVLEGSLPQPVFQLVAMKIDSLYSEKPQV